MHALFFQVYRTSVCLNAERPVFRIGAMAVVRGNAEKGPEKIVGAVGCYFRGVLET